MNRCAEGICVAVLVYAVDICICHLKHFSNPFLIVLSFFPSFLWKRLSPFKHSPVPSGFPCLIKREKNWKKMRIQFSFRNPSESLDNSGCCPDFGKKNIWKKEERRGRGFLIYPAADMAAIYDACCHCIHNSCCRQQAYLSVLTTAVNTFFLILSDTPHLFSFLKKRLFVLCSGLFHKGF